MIRILERIMKTTMMIIVTKMITVIMMRMPMIPTMIKIIIKNSNDMKI